MIQWATNLYIGHKVKKVDYIKSALERKEAVYGIYCILFASHPDNLFDIIEANELLYPYYQSKDLNILGLARGKEEAYRLVQTMLMEVYGETGAFQVKSYFT